MSTHQPLEQRRRSWAFGSNAVTDLRQRWESNYQWDEIWTTRSPQRSNVTSTREWLQQTQRVTQERVEALFKRLGRGPLSPIVELACGSAGPAVTWFATHGYSAIGIDISQTALDLLEQRLQEVGVASSVELKQGRIDRPIDIPSNSVDLIMASGVMMHLEDPQVTLSEAMRILRPGGIVHLDGWMNAYHPDHIIYRSINRLKDAVEGIVRDDPPRVPFFYTSRPKLRRLISEAGFEALEISVAREYTGLLARGWYPLKLTIPYRGRTRALLDVLNQRWPLYHLEVEWQTVAQKPAT